MVDILEKAERAQAAEHCLPGWEAGGDFVCRLRRPGLVAMAAALGFVPNPLMHAVEAMFFPAPEAKKLPIEEQAKALHAIAEYALVEPTMAQLNERGLTLTDEQYLAIYAFALKGAEGLSRFRDGLRKESAGDEPALSHKAVGADRA